MSRICATVLKWRRTHSTFSRSGTLRNRSLPSETAWRIFHLFPAEGMPMFRAACVPFEDRLRRQEVADSPPASISVRPSGSDTQAGLQQGPS